MPGISCVYALPKQNKLNRKRHRHCHGMHGQYNLPESRILRFSIPANAGASGGLRPPEPPTRGTAPLTPLGAYAAPRPPARLVTPLSFTNYLLQQKKTRTLITFGKYYLTKVYSQLWLRIETDFFHIPPCGCACLMSQNGTVKSNPKMAPKIILFKQTRSYDLMELSIKFYFLLRILTYRFHELFL